MAIINHYFGENYKYMSDQSIVFLLISTTLVLFIWGRVRYDLVAFMALIAGTIVGVIPTHGVFSGFGHPAACEIRKIRTN